MLGIFAKVLQGEPVKTRLQKSLSRAEAANFYVASLADTLETCSEVEANPTLFLQGGDDPRAVEDLRMRLLETGLDASIWARARRTRQVGYDLGERLENAFEELFRYGTRGSGALILGSDSPSLDTGKVRRGLQRLRETSEDTPRADVVLGPTADGGYWAIGLRTAVSGVLRQIAWSTDRTLEDTRRRARQHGLRVALLDSWTDVDVRADLEELARQIHALREEGDSRTARYSEAVLRELGILQRVQ